ncbi:MAG TPA: hypothetical protein VGG48_00900 [Rhizomicrobium sp.]
MTEHTGIFISTEDDIGQLKRRVDDLEKKLADIDRHVTEGFLHLSKSDREILELGSDTDERVEALEAKIFPNLHRVLNRLWKIVPPTNETLNDDLDRPRDRTGKLRRKRLK